MGTLSAIYFAVGTLRLSDKAIFEISSTYWDYNKNLASAITAQRAEYVVGAALLACTFMMQVAAVIVPPNNQSIFDGLLWALAAAAMIMAIIVLISITFCRAIARTMQSKVDRLAHEAFQPGEQSGAL